MDGMADDRDARIAQLEAEVRQLRARDVEAQAKIASLRAVAGSRDSALTAALEQQTATAEVLRVIASSPTDLQAVLAALAQNAARLCGATGADVLRLDDQGWRLV